MLVHSRSEIVDTQSILAIRWKDQTQLRVSMPDEPPRSFSLPELIKMEFGIDIQAGKCTGVEFSFL